MTHVVEEISVSREAVWVSGFGGAARIDPASNKIIWEFPEDTNVVPASVTVGSTAIWIQVDEQEPNWGEGHLYRIDPMTNGVEARIPLGMSASLVGETQEGVWYTWRTDSGDYRLGRIDALTNRIAAEIPIRSPNAAVIAEGAVWVVGGRDSRHLQRVDTRTDTVVSSLTVDAWTADHIAVSEQTQTACVWVAGGGSTRSAKAYCIDPIANRVISEVALPMDSVDGIVASGNRAYVFGRDSWGSLVTVLDESTDAVARTVRVGPSRASQVVRNTVAAILCWIVGIAAFFLLRRLAHARIVRRSQGV